MHDFNQEQTCSKCACPEYMLFVNDTQGQGIRCMDCSHEKIVVTPQNKRHKKRFKVRMKAAWDKQKTRREF